MRCGHVGDRLKLEGVLLGMVCGQRFVEDYEGAIPVARRHDEALTIRGPAEVQALR